MHYNSDPLVGPLADRTWLNIMPALRPVLQLPRRTDEEGRSTCFAYASGTNRVKFHLIPRAMATCNLFPSSIQCDIRKRTICTRASLFASTTSLVFHITTNLSFLEMRASFRYSSSVFLFSFLIWPIPFSPFFDAPRECYLTFLLIASVFNFCVYLKSRSLWRFIVGLRQERIGYVSEGIEWSHLPWTFFPGANI
jgi:hypothetical protein